MPPYPSLHPCGGKYQLVLLDLEKNETAAVANEDIVSEF